MGLLDGLVGDSWEDPRTQAMLALSAGLLSNNGSKGLSAGLLGAGQAYAGARDAESARALKKAQAEELMSQMQERQAKAAQMEAAIKAAQAKQAALPQIMAGNLPAAQPGQLGSGSFGIEAPAQGLPSIRQPQGINVMAGLQVGYSPDELQKLAGLRNIGQEEVARTIETTDAQGRPVTLQFDKFGRPVGNAAPKFLPPHFQQLGDRVGVLDPVTGQERSSVKTGTSPDTVYSGNITMRGQNMTDARARELNAINKEAGQTQIVNDPNQGPLLINKGTGLARPAVGLDGKPIMGEKDALAKKNASEVVGLIDTAKQLIPGSTGSFTGAGVDLAARVVGKGTEGAQRTAQLKALEGALMMKMPRMEGPQSNIDVANYRQAVGQIGDPTIPNETKMAALRTVEEIQRRYAGIETTPKQPGQLGSGSWGIQKVQ